MDSIYENARPSDEYVARTKNTKIYCKLVRDKIPEIIESEENLICNCKNLSGTNLIVRLIDKLYEEVGEFRSSLELEEIADIIEVCYALVRETGNTLEALEAVRKKKAEVKGAFNNGVYLVCTHKKNKENTNEA